MSKTRIKISSLEQEFDSLNSVFKSGKLKLGDTISLLTDVVVDSPVIIDKTCTLDLGGNILFVTVSNGITVKGGATVGIDNGDIQTLCDSAINDIIVSQGSKTEVMLRNNLYVNTNGTAIHARKRGNFIIEGASIQAIGDSSTVCIDGDASTVVVNSGFIKSFLNSAISVRNGGLAIINGGTIQSDASAEIPKDVHPAIIINGDQSKVIVNDGSIFADNSIAIQEQAGSTLEVNSGTIYNKSNTWPAIELNERNTAFKMIDGHVYSTQSYAFLANKTEVGYVQSIEVTGGRVGSGGKVVLTAGKGDHGVIFSGGSVKGDIEKSYLAEGYVVSDIKDDEGYAKIIRKTWEGDSDDSPVVFDDSPKMDDLQDLLVEGSNIAVVPNIPEPIATSLDTLPESVELDLPNVEVTNHLHIDSSVNIKHKIYIYRTPSKKSMHIEWIGALTVLNDRRINSDMDEFILVKYKLPGSGRTSTGYVILQDILSSLGG